LAEHTHDHPHDHGCRDISHLMRGIRRFRERFYEQNRELMQRLVDKGQSPPALVISCSDSRVDPTLLSDAEPGQLFVVRNVANLVPPYDPERAFDGAGAAIEYAVRDLKVDHIIVLGHAHCGGIKAMLGAAGGQWPERDFIGKWVSMALDASRLQLSETDAQGQPVLASLQRLKDNPALVERAAVAGSLKNLMGYPWVRERVEAGTLVLHGWWFDLDSGDLWATEPGSTQLMPVLE
jgi:carbonic anhydrase